MALFDSISARLGGFGIGPAMKKGINKVLTEDNASIASEINLVTTAWGRVISYQVTPQTTQRWGYGVEGKVQANTGIFYFVPKAKTGGDSGTAITGSVRVAIVNSEDIVKDYIISSIRTEELTKKLADGRDLVTFLAEQGYKAQPYDKLVVEILCDTDLTYSTSASSLLVNTTLYI